jgi:hypothetical protein
MIWISSCAVRVLMTQLRSVLLLIVNDCVMACKACVYFAASFCR